MYLAFFMVPITLIMTNHCPYCDNLKPALQVDNYCSHKRQVIKDIDSNAYYFSNKQLNSGNHISRFSIRTVTSGYQYYQVGNREHVINQDKFLVINEGENFENSVNEYDPVEGVIVAFNPDFLKYYLYHLNTSDHTLLDRPFDKTDASLYFYNNSYEKSEMLNRRLELLIRAIKDDSRDPIFYQQHFVNILDELVKVEHEMKCRINKINATKGRTREELYKRLSTAKDFVDANLNKKLSIEHIAQNSCLSPFHFLRTFSDYYGITPYQYILQERIKRAHYLVEKSDHDLTAIISESGFEHKRTFQRAYQKVYGITPYARLKTLRA